MTSGKNEIYIGDNLEVMKSDKFKKYHNSIGLIYIAMIKTTAILGITS